MVEYIADYLENIRDRRVFPAVKPGYIRELVPDHAPLEPEHWDTIFTDIERVIMPGVSKSQRLALHPVKHGDQGILRGYDVSQSGRVGVGSECASQQHLSLTPNRLPGLVECITLATVATRRLISEPTEEMPQTRPNNKITRIDQMKYECDPFP